MTEKSVIIVGSYRKNGNTTRISKKIAEKFGFDTINLNDYQFSYYDYDNNREELLQKFMKQCNDTLKQMYEVFNKQCGE